MTALDALAQERTIIRRPQKQETQKQSPMPQKQVSPAKYAPHIKQGQAQAQAQAIAEKYRYVQDVDLYFDDGSLKGAHKLHDGGDCHYIEIRGKYYPLEKCGEEFLGEKYNYQITYFDLPLYIKDGIAGVVALEKRVEGQKAASVLYGTLNGHDWVDLGLPSGTKWSTCNIGASVPEQPGNLYAWGETSTKSVYSTSNYTHQGKTLFDISGSSALDVATKLWGAGWRMPTFEEFKELLDNCESRYTDFGGRVGYMFTSRINRQSIFLPCAGYREEAKLIESKTNGIYWTSTPKDNSTSSVYIWMFGLETNYTGWGGGFYGHSVRAVTK